MPRWQQESPGAPPPQWGPRNGGIIACAVAGAVMAACAAAVTADPAGRVMVGVAAVGLLVFAAVSWRARPKLAVTADGLMVRGWWRTRVFGRADLKAIRISEFHRIGRKARLLEIDTLNDRLVVLSRWDLGTDPADVLDALTAAGYARP